MVELSGQSSETLPFASANARLKMDSTSRPSGAVKGLVSGDTIDLAGVTFVWEIDNNTLLVVENGVGYDLQFEGGYGNTVIHFNSTPVIGRPLFPESPPTRFLPTPKQWLVRPGREFDYHRSERLSLSRMGPAH
jgi:hypothetical protein